LTCDGGAASPAPGVYAQYYTGDSLVLADEQVVPNRRRARHRRAGFAKLYKEKVAALKPFVTMRIIMKHAYYVGAAHIADKLASGFPRGRYDDDVELIAASIASINGYRILTSTFQVTVYQGMECERPTSKLG
jgi:hypothetical protein